MLLSSPTFLIAISAFSLQYLNTAHVEMAVGGGAMKSCLGVFALHHHRNYTSHSRA
jgi:hypothetical protein